MSLAWRVLSVLLVAGSVGAAVPATASAAPPNQLVDPKVSPGSGSTGTPFTFAVDYASDKGYAATSVVAHVAGQAVALSLSSGTSTGGTYLGSSTLPAGTWSVSFEAQVTQGPGPSANGPTVIVSAPVPVAPQPPPAAPPPTAPPAPAAPAPAGPLTPAPQPVATANSFAEPSIRPARASQRDAASPTRPSADAGSPSPSSVVRPLRAPAAADPNNVNGAESGSLPGWLIAMIIIVVLLAGILVIATRREREGPLARGGAFHAPPPIPHAKANRRAIRPNQTEDPILAAMGIGETDGASPVDAPASGRVG